MKGVISITAFTDYLKDNNLVIAPAHLVVADHQEVLLYRKKILSKKALTYSEISKSKLWGSITQKRVYTIAKELAKPMEIFKPGKKVNSPEKILTTAVLRIAKQRQII